jgi:hypothetical protein
MNSMAAVKKAIDFLIISVPPSFLISEPVSFPSQNSIYRKPGKPVFYGRRSSFFPGSA